MITPTLRAGRCQCTACDLFFASERAFDRHRVGRYAVPGQWKHERRCLTIAEMTAAGWVVNGQGFYLTPDPRRAGAETQGPCLTLPATPVP